MRASFPLLPLVALCVTTFAQETKVAITLEGDPPVFRARGSAILGRINNPNFAAIFQVTPDRPGAAPVQGNYRVDPGGGLVFEPLMSLEPSTAYRAVFRLVNENATGVFTPPKPKIPSTTAAERVYPSSSFLPENQARFYLQFSAPMSRGEAAAHLHLRDEAGTEVRIPIPDAAGELWDRDLKRLTVLTGPLALFKAGSNYTLSLDQEWKDAAGIPLKAPFQKKFTALPAVRSPLDPKTWRVSPPGAGTPGPLVMDFPNPLDAALLERFIDVYDAKGKLIRGKVSLGNDEKRWLFTPAEPWKGGIHNIEVLNTLEDLAGNRIMPISGRETLSIPFTVGAEGKR